MKFNVGRFLAILALGWGISPSVVSAQVVNAPVVVDAAEGGDYVPTEPESDEEFTSLHSAEAPPAGNACQCPDCQKKAADAKKAAAEKKKKEDLKKAVNTAYAGVFYNNKFDYINTPLYEDCFLGDRLKQMKPNDCWTVDVGGQFRLREQSERNHRGTGLTGLDDDFLLYRTRLFVNAKYGDRLRFFAEGIDAESNYEKFAPRSIEVNRMDMLNLFADVDIFEEGKKSFTARIGRQEMLYGNQRLVSPLDWANTRRTFEGLNFLWRGEDWNADFFMVEPVTVNPVHFDSANDKQEFMGAYATYKKIKDQTIDLFAMQYNNATAPQQYAFTTTGGRWQGAQDQWLWEVEGGVQFGRNTDRSDHNAGYWTLGGGRKFEHDWKPTLWVFYDWASGGNDLGRGNGFNQLFPLGHKYLGFMDLFGRSNIESPNVQLTFAPHKKVNVMVWYYYFMLQNQADSPYNVNSTPFKPGNAPPSRDLGQELDLTVQYQINPRMDILFGYSHFFAGQYYKLSPPGPVAPPGSAGVPHGGDADFYYTQFQFNF